MSDDFHDRSTYLDRYAEHSSRLQTWVGAYGAGLASALVYQFRTALGDANLSLSKLKPLSEEAIDEGFKIAGMHDFLASALSLIGIALGLQIILLFINKFVQFTVAHMPDEKTEWTPWDRFAEWLSGKYVIDAICDVSSIGLLAAASVLALRALGL